MLIAVISVSALIWIALGRREAAVVLIAGGDGKGADFSALQAPVARFCRAVVLLGRDAEQIAEALGDAAPLLRVKTLDEAGL